MEQDAPVFFSTPYPELNAILEQVYRHRGADGRGSLRQLSEVVDKLVEKWAAASAPADSVLEDAARYRHLRDCNSGSLVVMQITGTGEDDWHVLTEHDADAAIDAARKQEVCDG